MVIISDRERERGEEAENEIFQDKKSGLQKNQNEKLVLKKLN